MKNILMMTWLMVMTSYILVTLASIDDVESGLKVGYHKYQKRFIKTLKDLEQGKGERLSYGWGKRSGHNSHNNRNADNINNNNNNKNNHNGDNIRKKTDDVEGAYNVVDDFGNGEIFGDGLELSDLEEIVDNYKNKFRNINKNENFGKINNNDKSFNVADNNSNNNHNSNNNNNDDDNKVLLPRSNGRFKKLFNKLQQKSMTSSSNSPSSSSSSASYAHPLSVEMEYDGLAY